MVKVSSADFQRHIGQYQDKALSEPVVIIRNGRERVVGLAEELGDTTIELIEKTKMDVRYNHLDGELGDWKP